MEKLKKLSYAKAIDSDKKTVSGYVSTFEVDRDGERFAKGAWDLSSFLKNPVVLWAHDHSLPPIGRAVDLIEDDHGLIGVTEFDKDGELANQVFRLFEKGYLHAFSVGFIRKNFQMEDGGPNQKEKVLAITEAELYEYSAVSVPANPGALVSRETAEIAIKTIGPKCIEVIKSQHLGDQFFVLPGTGDDPEELDLGNDKGADQLDSCLHKVIEMARAIKGQGVPNETRRALLLTAIDVLKEQIQESPSEASVDQIVTLKGVLVELAGLASRIAPEAGAMIQKTISQIDKALAGNQAAA